MKKLLLSGAAAVALTCAVSANANAALLDIVGGLAFVTPANGVDGITGNQIIPNVSGYVGAELRVAANVTLTYTFIGFEAGRTNHFLVDDVLAFINQSASIGR